MSAVSTSLASLFPDGDHRFHLTLRRGEPREFFARRDSSGRVRAERAHWLRDAPSRYAAVSPPAEPILREFAELAAEWEGATSRIEPTAPSSDHARPDPDIHALGAQFEPDLLFLSPDAAGRFRLRAGALCFPTGWALEEKLGHTLDEIHGVVPGLNPALGGAIQQFLTKLRPGTAFLRDNWGLTATAELNLHPARQIAPPEPPVALDRLWLRVEHQAILALPQTGGIVFGIRIALHRLDAVARDPAAGGLRRALETMPGELARYKRIDSIIPLVTALL